MKKKKSSSLSPLEDAVMQIVWSDQPVTADDVRAKLKGTRELKESTVRTLLRRLEDKGFVEHDVQGRTYVYRAKKQQENVAASAVRSIVDRFCKGSVETLLIGLVNDKQISPQRLKELASEIAAAETRLARNK